MTSERRAWMRDFNRHQARRFRRNSVYVVLMLAGALLAVLIGTAIGLVPANSDKIAIEAVVATLVVQSVACGVPAFTEPVEDTLADNLRHGVVATLAGAAVNLLWWGVVSVV